jgi:drug/metabolite transporter (DMT)-like permease
MRLLMPKHFSTTAWVLLALTAASIEPVLVKLGFQLEATPLQLLVLKNIVGAIVMLLLVRGWRRPDPRQVRFRDILIVSLLLMSTNALVILALTKLTAVELITIITTTPLMVALANYRRRKDKHGPLFWPGLGAAIAGVILSLQISALSLNCLGAALALAAVLSSTTYRIRIESILAKADPAIVSLNVFVVNGIIAIACLPFIGPVTNLAQVAPFTLWMGMAGAVANLAFIAAIKELGATRMSVINLTQRPLVVLIAAVALKEVLSWPQILGFALVIAGVQMAQVKPRQSAPYKDPTTGAETNDKLTKELSSSGR